MLLIAQIVKYKVDHSVSLFFFFFNCFCFVLFTDLLKQTIQVTYISCILPFYTEEDRNVKSLQITIDTK